MITLIDKVKMFKEIVNEMANLYEKKNSNYGDSFGQLYDALGPISGLVPLHNKLDRATSLIKGDKNNFESLEDTFKDLACYAIMNLIEIKSRANSHQHADLDVYVETPYKLDSNPWVFPTAIKNNPCENCATHKQLSQGLFVVGDIPCQWCPYGTLPTCKTFTSELSSNDLVNNQKGEDIRCKTKE